MRPTSASELLGIGIFSETANYNAGQHVLYNKVLYRFTTDHSAGAWNANHVKQISTLDLILASVGDPRIKPLSASSVKEGDMLFYDRARQEYCTVAKEMVASVLADYNATRYETNHDTYIGTFDGVAHFVARDDAMANNSLYSDTVAATSCFYRIEIDNSVAGSITFSVASGNGSVASNTISWSAGEAMSAIVAKFTAKSVSGSYIVFKALADGKGVGLEVGGNGANTLTVSASTACTVIDCSGFAFYLSQNPAVKMGDTFNPDAAYTFIGKGVHHNFRGAAVSTIQTGKGLVAANSSCIGNDGYNYSYRTGVNFAKWKEWASVSGDSAFEDDGEGGTDESVGKVMKEAEFNADVRDYTGSDSHHLGMKEYYTHLFTDQTGDYATLRQKYEAMYGKMTSMYDAYLMSHIMDVAANSGITANMRNKGKNQTTVKADCMNVNYDYKVIPAYPPEYNATHYGVESSEGFAPSTYYHPEPGDIGLFLRDDIMQLVNANITASGGGTALTNSVYRGSSADYTGLYTWYFYGAYGCFYISTRYCSYFRSRPVLALAL